MGTDIHMHVEKRERVSMRFSAVAGEAFGDAEPTGWQRVAYDWDREIVKTGVVPLAKADRARSHFHADSLEEMQGESRSVPKSCSGGVMGRGVVSVSYQAGCALLADPGVRVGGMTYYVSVEWRAKLSDACAPFLAWANTLAATIGDPERVRLVFGFDS